MTYRSTAITKIEFPKAAMSLIIGCFRRNAFDFPVSTNPVSKIWVLSPAGLPPVGCASTYMHKFITIPEIHRTRSGRTTCHTYSRSSSTEFLDLDSGTRWIFFFERLFLVEVLFLGGIFFPRDRLVIFEFFSLLAQKKLTEL